MVRENNYDHVHQAQEHFRLILSAMANPGKINLVEASIDPIGNINKAAAIVGLALLNQDVTFHIQSVSTSLRAYFTLNTASLPATAEKADFLFLNGDISVLNAIKSAKVGDPEYPETGAFLIIDSTFISESPIARSLEMVLKGPGVKGTKKVYLSGVHPAILDQILIKNAEYPLGVDSIFTDYKGNILCVPRTNQFQYKKLP